jgi:hypothetical protein
MTKSSIKLRFPFSSCVGHTGYYLDTDISDNAAIIQTSGIVNGIHWGLVPGS